MENELSVTIIATGFQTSEERKKEKENERVEIPLTPEEPRTPYVKPINQFVQKKEKPVEAEPVQQAPVAKNTTAAPAQQADLFSAASAKPQLRNSTPENDGIIRHNLAPQQEPVEEKQEDDGYEVKTTPSTLHFELPTVVSDSTAETKQPQADDQPERHVAPPKEIAKRPDEEKTPEFVEEQLLKTKERILRLKELSMKLKSANGLQELETEPAYRRKQLALDDVPHSSESQVSRFTLSTDEGITEIRPNNSFLHDNVD